MRELKQGYTTGSCAAAAAQGAARRLLLKKREQAVSISLPGGGEVTLPLTHIRQTEESAVCAVKKDSGDDPDITNGIQVYAEVKYSGETGGISIEGGKGIGRVTKPGLECAVGQPAINRVPRRMIADEVRRIKGLSGYSGGLKVIISIPDGEKVAQKTYNGKLGIVGGLSILGTSGLVQPMSEQALIETIRAQMSVIRASGEKCLVAAPGNYGRDFLKKHWGWSGESLLFSNFLGETIDLASEFGFEKLCIIGHAGKMVKVSAGIMNTHSKYADARLETLCCHAALCGASAETIRRVFQCVTTDEAIGILKEEKIWPDTALSLASQLEKHLADRAGSGLKIAAAVFSNRYGILYQTADLRQFLNK